MLSNELRAARRALEGMSDVALLEDWTWEERANIWRLKLRLSITHDATTTIPAMSDWYVFAAATYPRGLLKVLPAQDGGLHATFQHQAYNGRAHDDVPWRLGALCLDSSVATLHRHADDSEPHSIDDRLRWHIERALLWLNAAAHDALVQPGDPFELPQFPMSANNNPLVVFAEGTDSFSMWNTIEERSGIVELTEFRSNIYVARRFRTPDGRLLATSRWGEAINASSQAKVRGIWLRAEHMPILPPWQAPATWQQLRSVFQDHGQSLDRLLQRAVSSMRDGKQHVGLIGFPIPAVAGAAPVQMHWQAFLLPVLSRGRATHHGFRPNTLGYWFNDRRTLFQDKAIDWISSENWHVAELSTRGRLNDVAVAKTVAILGVGALGSVVAELLLRAGIHHLILVDGDIFRAGNLARHILTLEDLFKPKASAMADRLQRVSPHASVQAIDHHFPPVESDSRALLQQADVVIDCTANDDLLFELEKFDWNEPHMFASLSLGFRAQRLFCFATPHVSTFPRDQFADAVEPFLTEERPLYSEQALPREGIGCWHPVFPARFDDIVLMAARAVQWLEKQIASPPQHPMLSVFKQHDAGGIIDDGQQEYVEEAGA